VRTTYCVIVVPVGEPQCVWKRKKNTRRTGNGGKIERRATMAQCRRARTPFVEERLVPSFIHKNNDVTRRHYTWRGTRNQKYLHWCGIYSNRYYYTIICPPSVLRRIIIQNFIVCAYESCWVIPEGRVSHVAAAAAVTGSAALNGAADAQYNMLSRPVCIRTQ